MEGIYPYSFLLDIMCESGLRLILVNKKRYKGEYMATIKDVAKQAGVSVTTVSIIINGKAEERKISAATQQRVAEAMRDLGYQPNLSARRLRSQENERPVIAFFWPLDYRVSILASFLNFIQIEIAESGFDCEMMIQTYENDKLEQYGTTFLKNGYSGAIIGACSAKDQQWLEGICPRMPVILINRESEHFSTVCTDNDEVGLMAATKIRQKGYTEAAIFASRHSYFATSQRVQAFISSCERLGLETDEKYILKGSSTRNGGYEIGKQYAALKEPPKMIFCDSDAIALGALRAFHEEGISVPGDAELLSIGMLDPEAASYYVPSLSVVEMPNKEIGQQVLRLMRKKILNNDMSSEHVKVHAKLMLRESFS